MRMEKEYVEMLIERFTIEYRKKDRSGIYGLTQRLLTYNSNRIEGSTLTEQQTASLFHTGLLESDGSTFKAKDIEEATGHFAMFNHMLDTLDMPLSQELIKAFHSKLKNGVFEDILNGFPVGEYKNRRNTVDDIKTALPNEVEKKMDELLSVYDIMKKHTLLEIAQFHIFYESIHPFQDGNGRTGRIIAFRECLKSGIIPFIVEDKNKQEYYTALREYQKTKSVQSLFNFFQKEQDIYFHIGVDYVVPYGNKSVDERIEDALHSKKELEIKYHKSLNDTEK